VHSPFIRYAKIHGTKDAGESLVDLVLMADACW
jgi:hypothetical protein